MELSDKEKQVIAYMRAYKENQTRRKTLYLGIIALFFVLLDIALISSKLVSPGVGIGIFIIIMTVMNVLNYNIRKKEKVIVKKVLGE